MEVLAGKRPLEDLLKSGLPPAERLVYLRSVSDVLEDPDTFFGRRAKTLGPLVVAVAVVLWSAGAVASLAYGEWSTAGLCFAGAMAFLLGGLVGIRKDRYRYEVLETVVAELDRLENRRLPEPMEGAGG